MSAVFRFRPEAIAELFGLVVIGPARMTPDDIVIPVRAEGAEGELYGVVTRHDDGHVSLTWGPA